MNERVTSKLEDGAALLELEFERDKGNVLTRALMRQLTSALDEHSQDSHLKLVILYGHGANFSFGASVEEHRRDQAPEMLQTFHALVRRLATYPVPVLALVRGRCLGAGFELALASRFVFASHNAVFACPEIKLGVFPPVLAALGPARLGLPWTERLLLTGAELDAARARELGFVTEIVADGTDPMSAARAWYERSLRPLSAFSIRQALSVLRIGSHQVEALGEPLGRIERNYLERLLPSHDANEGIEAFIEKRQPVWRDA